MAVSVPKQQKSKPKSKSIEPSFGDVTSLPNDLLLFFAAWIILFNDSLYKGWSNWPGIPSDADKSKWPTHKQFTSIREAISFALFAPSFVSIKAKNVFFWLDNSWIYLKDFTYALILDKQ